MNFSLAEEISGEELEIDDNKAESLNIKKVNPQAQF